MTEAPASVDFWPTIFQSFRPEDHKFLVVATNNGLEVAVQEIVRVEAGLVIIRGRIAGTADSGRLFLLPFAQLSSVYVNRVVRMEEVDLFSPSVAPARKLEVARAWRTWNDRLATTLEWLKLRKMGTSILRTP